MRSWFGQQLLGRHPTWRGVMRLLRLSNSAPAGALVLLGARLAGDWPPAGRVWWAAAAMWCITAFGYVSNDLADLAEDVINKPDRPLPSGAVTVRSARILAGLLALAALGISSRLGLLEAAVAGAVMAMLLVYNNRLKASAGVGNLAVAILAGATLVTGAVASRGLHIATIGGVLAPAALLGAFIFGREVIKTVEDVSGDLSAGKQTLAVRLGAAATVRLLLLPSLLTIGLLLQLWSSGRVSTLSIALLAVGVALPLLTSTLYLWRDQAPARASRCLAVLKASYFVGIAALVVA